MRTKNELFQWVINSGLQRPVRCSIGLHKIAKSGTVRYLRVFINGKDITEAVADATGYAISRARDTNGCIIVHGCGTDAGVDVVYLLNRSVHGTPFEIKGCPLFERSDYTYLGRYRNGKYVLND